MKLGLVSAILSDLNFEEVIAFAAQKGFSCIELACWPPGQAERRYAGVTHVDVAAVDDKRAEYILDYCKSQGIEISALGYYPNPLDPDLEKRAFYIQHIKAGIKAAGKLQIKNYSTFIGRDQFKNVEENLKLFKAVWTPLIEYAEQQNVNVIIENCPMYFTNDEWPGGKNLATTPVIWRKLFEIIPSKNFGLNYDPSHFLWQNMDYIKPIYEFKDRIYHVHIKDMKVYKDKLNEVGSMARPLEYISPKIPGLGQINWSEFISALTDIGYQGAACIEVEDKAFEETFALKEQAIILSKRHISPFIV
ncbi:sugar phosphate isomerase/epimerase [Pelosinus sp. UFO1]|uniref:sugar phosphate isomerase/epimerase family protein n=1 Tax=Pelosinus sp. UFO1 TaxID=484770 RepID=UPI0004D16B32|nr:sugar phosphate isomerase/epimerase family protein [Pelosinus sp. UFO1]AIF53000.1 Xylose isomerase domain-containing protein TIM barrel [Pelosinus sp. UFO1]